MTRRIGIGRARPLWALLALLLASGAVGCVSKPTLELYGAQVRSASPAGIGVELWMRVNNDNAFDVKVRNVRVSVLIAKRYQLPPIVYNPDRWLPAGGTTLVPVPVTVPWPMVGPLLATTAGSTKVSYRVRGVADVTAVRMLGIEVNDHEVNEEGSISRAALLMAAGRGVVLPIGRR